MVSTLDLHKDKQEEEDHHHRRGGLRVRALSQAKVPAEGQDDLLEAYKRHQEGPHPSRKLKENVGGKMWVSILRGAHIAETTVDHYLKNVAQFLDYMSETPPLSCHLSKQAMLRIRREVRTLLKSLKKKVTMHQIWVKQAKEGWLIPKVVLHRCREEAKKGNPAAPRSTGERQQPENAVHALRLPDGLLRLNPRPPLWGVSKPNYLGGGAGRQVIQHQRLPRQCCTAQDKPGVRPGPTVADVRGVWVGLATSLAAGRTGGRAKYPGAWVLMGLPGKPTFTDIRTSIATHAKNSHGTDSRQKVAQFMCHDTSTADKFYAVNLNARQAVEHRRLFEEALEGVEASSTRADDTTSSQEAETVPYQESGVSALESEEAKKIKQAHRQFQWEVAMGRLRELQASNPEVPMVTLDGTVNQSSRMMRPA
ncbi:hypothetical protein IRJ41_018877 [Triplophysa rosa]|uniref:Uncharacterized protein n=1 Tax=Triplophysa rosa TaxID=992332 RepID=A0A9W7X0H3_TRIRA|nr:hypothetical protein IRJ41_018877 [Triplophysa rosa]